MCHVFSPAGNQEDPAFPWQGNVHQSCDLISDVQTRLLQCTAHRQVSGSTAWTASSTELCGQSNHWAWYPDHITAALRELHWLPVHQRIKYKVLTMVYKVLYSDDAPGYLQDLVTWRAVGRTLRSSNIPQLTVPRTVAKSQTLVDLCFSVAVPSMYNYLPDGMRKDLSFTSFKRKLKTQLFIEYFGH